MKKDMPALLFIGGFVLAYLVLRKPRALKRDYNITLYKGELSEYQRVAHLTDRAMEKQRKPSSN